MATKEEWKERCEKLMAENEQLRTQNTQLSSRVFELENLALDAVAEEVAEEMISGKPEGAEIPPPGWEDIDLAPPYD